MHPASVSKHPASVSKHLAELVEAGDVAKDGASRATVYRIP